MPALATAASDEQPDPVTRPGQVAEADHVPPGLSTTTVESLPPLQARQDQTSTDPDVIVMSVAFAPTSRVQAREPVLVTVMLTFMPAPSGVLVDAVVTATPMSPSAHRGDAEGEADAEDLDGLADADPLVEGEGLEVVEPAEADGSSVTSIEGDIDMPNVGDEEGLAAACGLSPPPNAAPSRSQPTQSTRTTAPRTRPRRIQ